MRKLIVAVMALGLVAAMKVPSFAQYLSLVSSATLTASVQFTAAGSVNASYVLVNLTGGTPSPYQIWWSTGLINPGTTAWQRADDYIVLSSTLTDSRGAIRIYTNNCNSNNINASPYYGYGVQNSSEALSGSYDPEGLIASSTNTKTLSMCWRVASATYTMNPVIESINITSGTTVSTRLYDQATGSGFPCYLWMMDKGTYNFYSGNALDYAIIRDSSRGIQYAESNWGTAASTVNVYLGANFTNMDEPDTFSTNSLVIEAFLE